jgi:hypothetical protein
MSDGKKLVAQGRPGPVPSPIMACLADLPEIVRHLEAAEFEIDSAFERYEEAPAPAPDLAGREAIAVVEEWLSMAKDTPKPLHSSLNYVPICQSEIDAIRSVLALIKEPSCE